MTELCTLSLTRDIDAITALLDAGGIRLAEGLDVLYGAYGDGQLLGCCGRRGNVIECAAVSPDARGEGVLNVLVSALYTDIRTAGYEGAFVFTRPAAKKQFASLGFCPLAEVPEAVLLYSRRDGLDRYVASLPEASGARVGAVVMNANPFTNGHRYLVEQAAAACDRLYVFVVEEDASRFSFADRLMLVQAGTRDLTNVAVCPGGPFMISRATFPSYFLKKASDASRVHAALDATLFAIQLAPRLHITSRYVGSEPFDALTMQYNESLCAILPRHGVQVCLLDRLTVDGAPVSASHVRQLFDENDFAQIRPLVPDATYQYLREQKQHE